MLAFGKDVPQEILVQYHPLNLAICLKLLRRGARVIQSPVGYHGVWYQRPDGSVFGVRRSEGNGITIDVIQHDHPIITNGYKVHQK
jgi:hypothetical protein